MSRWVVLKGVSISYMGLRIMEAVSGLREQWELPKKEPMGAQNDVMVEFRGTICRESPEPWRRPFEKPRTLKSSFQYPEWQDWTLIKYYTHCIICFIFCFFHKEDDDLEVTETSPRAGLEPRTKLANSAEKTQASSLDLALSSVDLKVLEDRMKLIDKRLSNLESEISLVIPFLRKTLKAED